LSWAMSSDVFNFPLSVILIVFISLCTYNHTMDIVFAKNQTVDN
jgi:hypothetical protein